MKRLMTIFTVLVLTIGMVQAQDDPKPLVADWQGDLEIRPGTKYQIRFHIRNKNGVLTAKMDNVDLNSFGLEFNEVTYKEGVLTMKIDRIQGTYTGKLEDGELKGTWKQAQTELTLNLQRRKTS